jgi:hypothetical protein
MARDIWEWAVEGNLLVQKLGALTPLFTRVSVSCGYFPGKEMFINLDKGLREWLCSSVRRYVNAANRFSDTKYP